MSFQGKRLVVTGPRYLHPDDRKLVYSKLIEALKDHPVEVIIGGAMGVDTAAFVACAKVKFSESVDFDLTFDLTVILPGFLGNAPYEFREALQNSGLHVNAHPGILLRMNLIELGLDPGLPQSYHARNGAMLTRAMRLDPAEAVLLAFPAIDKAWGGTHSMIEKGRKKGVEVDETPVRVLK